MVTSAYTLPAEFTEKLGSQTLGTLGNAPPRASTHAGWPSYHSARWMWPLWKQHITPETPVVRAIDRGELQILLEKGRIYSRGAAKLIEDPIGGADMGRHVSHSARAKSTGHLRVKGKTAPQRTTTHQDLISESHEMVDGKLLLKQSHGVTGGGKDVFPVSYFSPAESGYEEAVINGDRFLVKFKRDTLRLVDSAENTHIMETEGFIPLKYDLKNIEYIADVKNNRYLFQGGQWSTESEAAELFDKIKALPPEEVGTSLKETIQNRITIIKAKLRHLRKEATQVGDHAKAAQLKQEMSYQSRLKKIERKLEGVLLTNKDLEEIEQALNELSPSLPITPS